MVILHDTLEGIVGKHMVHKVFSLLATLFIFIVTANWFGLLPGVGSIGWGEVTGQLSIYSSCRSADPASHHRRPEHDPRHGGHLHVLLGLLDHWRSRPLWLPEA